MKAAPSTRTTQPLIWIAALLTLGLDQWSKARVILSLADGHDVMVVPHVLDFVFVRNMRGAYGLFGDQPWFLIGISIAAFIVIFLSFRERARRSWFIAVPLGLVLGGAVGNVLDRVHYHFVVDFIRIIPLPIFEVFNVADAAISIGIVLIIFITLNKNEQVGETVEPL